MKIVVTRNMVSIDDDGIVYSNIRDMYRSGNGEGLQIIQRLEHRREQINRACAEISNKLYELQDMMDKDNG